MAKTTRKKAAAAQYPIPQSLDEAAHFVAEIGRERRTVEGFERNLNERITQLREECAASTKAHNERIEELFRGLEIYAAANRKRLCQDGGKSCQLATGWLRWRMTPPKVSVRGEADVLASLTAQGLSRYIRTQRSVNKQAILDDPTGVSDIEGISVTQKEEFVVEPNEDEIQTPETKASVGYEVQL